MLNFLTGYKISWFGAVYA